LHPVEHFKFYQRKIPYIKICTPYPYFKRSKIVTFALCWLSSSSVAARMHFVGCQ